MKALSIIWCLLHLAVIATANTKILENLFHDASNRFSAKMFSEVVKVNSEKSFVLSAYSVMTPLALLSIAARESTRDQLWDAIGTNNDNDTIQVFTSKNERVQSIEGVTLKTASKIYLALNYDVFTWFGIGRWDTFGSELQNIDFDQNKKAANEINTWVEEHTNNLIKDIVTPDSVDTYTRALLVDAVYFKGIWKTRFEKSLTSEQYFHINNREAKKISMMHRRGNYKYLESSVLKSQVIEIPYKGGEASLVVVLPVDIEGITEVQEILKDPTVLDNARKRMYKAGVDLHLPKFKIETTSDLKDILQKNNVMEMFSNYNARLDYLIRVAGNMYITSAIQKAYIEIDEDGETDSVFNLDLLSVVGGPTYNFNANHPFIFFILEGNNILLNGEYYS